MVSHLVKSSSMTSLWLYHCHHLHLHIQASTVPRHHFLCSEFGQFCYLSFRYNGLNVIELAVLLMKLTDTCAEGDGERNDVNQKRLLSCFSRFSSFSKYALEMFTSIAQVEALLSEEVAHRVTWGKFVNWTGGLGNNIKGDKAQEICNCTSKNVVQGMGPNKTNNALITAS